MRRKLTLVVSSLFVIFLVFFLSREISPKQFNKNNLDSNISLDQPIWKVNQTNSPISYNISANRAFQNRTDEKFILEKVVIKEFLDSQVHSSIKSDNAFMDLDLKNLTLSEKVHLNLRLDGKELDLFTNEIILDLMQRAINSSQKIKLRMHLFVLESEGFQIKDREYRNKEISFSKAVFSQEEKEEAVYGKADLIIHNFPSDVLILKGSAEIKFNSSTLKGDEIQFNYKTRTIIKSKNSKLIKS
ncbi:MAG: LPS export ABC transporter periplasmic protein LptC [Gammaproteobacteria bacterium]|nr:LPS export ABC transporter periplasmic protein LptC [Gammaproteobacteria bacterium]